MAKIFEIILVVATFCYVQQVQSITEEDMLNEYMAYALKCAKEHPVEASELLALQKYIVPTNPDAKCLLACSYKLAGTMNAQGMYDIEAAYKMAERLGNGDPKRLENGKKMVDICGKEANEATVSDGEKGCERATILFKCSIENAPKFGFKLPTLKHA